MVLQHVGLVVISGNTRVALPHKLIEEGLECILRAHADLRGLVLSNESKNRLWVRHEFTQAIRWFPFNVCILNQPLLSL